MHTYFSAKVSAYTLGQINFSAHTYFRKNDVFCLINATPGLNSLFAQARKHIGFDFTHAHRKTVNGDNKLAFVPKVSEYR